MPRNWKVPVTVMLSESEIDEIDAERGKIPRSSYLRDVIMARAKKK